MLRHFIFLIWSGLAALPALAQGPALYQGAELTLTEGATLYVQGDLQNVSGGSFDNRGSVLLTGNLSQQSSTALFTNGGELHFVGTTTQTIGGSGSGAVALDNLVLNKTDQLVLDRHGVSVSSGVQFISGNLYLNGGFSLDLGSTGQLVGEKESSRALGPGMLTAQAELNAPSAANPGALGLLISSSQNLGMTTITRSHSSTGPDGMSILRNYQVSPTHNENLNATLRFSYFDAELGALEESALAPFTSADGTDWKEQEVTASSTTDNYVEYGNLASLHLTTLSQGGYLPVADAGSYDPICQGASLLIGGNPTATEGTAPYTYSWSPIEGLNDANLANPTATPASTTIYTVTVTDANGNTAQDEVEIIVHPFPTLTFDAVGPLCPTAAAVDLSAFVSPKGGIFSGHGVSGSMFDPGTAGIGEHQVSYAYTDGKGCKNTAVATVIVVDNTAPVADVAELPDLIAECSLEVNESNTPTATDNCGGIIKATTTDPLSYTEQGTYTITWHYDDSHGNTSSQTQTVKINNTAPVITNITAPVDPVAVNTAVTASVDYTDNNIALATFDWGDGGSTTEGPATGPTGTISSTYTYTTAGVYTLSVTLLDECGEPASTIYQYIVIYDPYGGFATGGGWIDSPAGAYAADPTLTGRASFGFVSKYKPGTNTPTGNTDFQFKAANLNFKSTSYDWLVVAGHSAKFKGDGMINEGGSYGFMLSAVDGALKGDGIDRFRIKIWDKTSGTVIYDNEVASDDAEASTAIAGGSIVIHKAKSGSTARYDDATAMGQAIGEEGLETPATFKLTVYPNPLQKELSVELQSETQEEITISIYDLLGRRVYEQKQSVVKGANQIMLDVDSWKVTTDQLLFRVHTPSKGLHQLILLMPE